MEDLDDHTESFRERTKHSEETDDGGISKKESRRSEDPTTSKDGLSMDNFSDGNEYNHNLDVDITRRNTADSDTEDSRVNAHQVIGASWQLIHHHPTALLPSLSSVNTTSSSNTTMHSEYLGDDVVGQYDTDDVTQYKRTEKSRRKPRVSLVRPVRSFQTDYEVRELKEVRDPAQRSHEDDENVVVVNTRAIKRDGKFQLLRLRLHCTVSAWSR